MSSAAEALSAPAQPRTDPARARERTLLWLAMPALVVLGVLFVWPLLRLLSMSVADGTLAQFEKAALDGLYVAVLWNSLEIALLVTVICLVLAYPVALWLVQAGPVGFVLGMFFLLLPFWTSVLVRTYAWTVLMRRNGLINDLLVGLGLTDAPVRLLYTEGAVVVAMAHVLLPFMVLPLWTALRAIPTDYARAAAVLGAPPWRSFVEVTLPLSLPGVASGSLMVFLLALGFFVTPALVGGPQQMMIATLISQQVRELLNWPFAGALVGCLLLLTLVLVATFNRAMRLDRFVASS